MLARDRVTGSGRAGGDARAHLHAVERSPPDRRARSGHRGTRGGDGGRPVTGPSAPGATASGDRDVGGSCAAKPGFWEPAMNGCDGGQGARAGAVTLRAHTRLRYREVPQFHVLPAHHTDARRMALVPAGRRTRTRVTSTRARSLTSPAFQPARARGARARDGPNQARQSVEPPAAAPPPQLHIAPVTIASGDAGRTSSAATSRTAV